MSLFVITNVPPPKGQKQCGIGQFLCGEYPEILFAIQLGNEPSFNGEVYLKGDRIPDFKIENFE
jgi:hypothetical protein